MNKTHLIKDNNMLFITPELAFQQDAYHQKMHRASQLRHYWLYLLKYPLFDNSLLFILFIFPFFALFSYPYFWFLLPFPSMVLFSYLTALLAHTTNGYALPPRGDKLLAGFFIQVILLIGSRSNKSKMPFSPFILLNYLHSRLVSQTEDKVQNLGQKASPIAVKQILFVIFSMGLLTWCSHYVNSVALSLMILLWFSLLPACLLQIAIDDSLFSGLHLIKIQSFIRKMDNEYAWVIFATSLTASLLYYTIFQLSGFLFIISLLMGLYLLIACFHLLGYLLYHRRHIIGFIAENSPESKAEVEADNVYAQADGIVQQAKVQLTDRGLFKYGFEILKLRLSTAHDDLTLHREVSSLLFEWQDKRLALKHAQIYLHLLIQQQKYVTAYQILQKSRARQADFSLAQAEDYQPLIAHLLHIKQDFSLTLYLIECFEQQYPTHQQFFEIQLSKAILLSEYSQYDEQVKMILGELIQENDHPLHKKALKLAQRLRKQSILQSQII